MQYKNPDVIRCDARNELLKNIPSWLRVRGPKTLPIIWLQPARVFVSLTESVLGIYAPLSAILRMHEMEGHLKIDLVLSALHSETDAVFDLRRVAEHFEELSALLLKSVKNTGPSRFVKQKRTAQKEAANMLDLTRFNRHLIRSKLKRRKSHEESQRAQQVKMIVPSDSIVKALNVLELV